jgi:hypothetical protein
MIGSPLILKLDGTACPVKNLWQPELSLGRNHTADSRTLQRKSTPLQNAATRWAIAAILDMSGTTTGPQSFNRALESGDSLAAFPSEGQYYDTMTSA